jgi:hypothetical protein
MGEVVLDESGLIPDVEGELERAAQWAQGIVESQ